MALCEHCRRRLKPWAESLRDIWNGCNILLDEDVLSPLIAEYKCEENILQELLFPDNIVADEYGTGWVTNNVQAFNNQLLIKNTIKCKYFLPIIAIHPKGA